jgi:hypothetical protein
VFTIPAKLVAKSLKYFRNEAAPGEVARRLSTRLRSL